jgi:hypothetical protein
VADNPGHAITVEDLPRNGPGLDTPAPQNGSIRSEQEHLHGPGRAFRRDHHPHLGSEGADAEGGQQLARYMIRCPFALNKISYDRKSGVLIYRCKLHATLERNCALMPALKRETVSS